MADRTILLVALAGAVLLAGCGPALETGSRGEEEPAEGATAAAEGTNGKGVRLPLLTPSNDTDSAGLDGVLKVEGRCLYLTQPGRSQARTLLAFTIPGISWDGKRTGSSPTAGPSPRGNASCSAEAARWTPKSIAGPSRRTRPATRKESP